MNAPTTVWCLRCTERPSVPGTDLCRVCHNAPDPALSAEPAPSLAVVREDDETDVPRPVSEPSPKVPEPKKVESPRLLVRDLPELLEHVEQVGNTGWLIEGLWPADAYGMFGAEDKAGKTWSVADLAVSVRTGTPWLGEFPCPNPGPVLMFWGEGGERAMLRRIQAVVESKGLVLGDLMPGFRSCYRVPKLKDPGDVAAMRAELEAFPAALVVLDPLFLAASGAHGADIFDMGHALSEAQAACQDAGSALVVVHHWNQTGTGSGWKRLSGAGPSAWGRVLGSAGVESSATDPETMASTVVLRWEFVGGEIPPTEFTVRRRVWTDDPKDLGSAMHYAAEVTGSGASTPEVGGRRIGRTKQRLLDALKGHGPEDPISTRDLAAIVDADGKGKPYGERTYQKALVEMAEMGLVDGEDDGPGTARRWWLT